MHDRETLESILHRVHLGELSPAEATRLLLADAYVQPEYGLAQSDPRQETLASLVTRLGEPPTDIVDHWCQQLGDFAGQLEQETGESLPTLELNQWSITSDGNLGWQGRSIDTTKTTAKPSLASLDRINEFRCSLIPSAAPRADAAGVPAGRAVSRVEVANQGCSQPSSKPQRPINRWFQPVLRRGLLAVVTVLCVSIAGWLMYVNSTRPADKISANINTPVPRAIGIGPSGSSNVAPPVLDSSADVGTLETLESMTQAEPAPLETETVEMESLFSLDALMPPAIGMVPDLPSRDEGDGPAEIGVGPADPQVWEPNSGALALGEGDGAASPTESPQPTRTSTVMAVELHGIEETIEPTRLSPSSLRGLKLDFPYDVPLTLQGDGSNWQVRDSRLDTSVAVIANGPDGLGLKWSDSARQSPSASALTHGRISDDRGGTIFLRPRIEADPWPIRLDKPDVMPTWNLREAIPPRVARISVDLDIPDEIEMGWIEPIQPESPRRTRGLLVLTPKDGESVSLGIRLDIRCSRKLSCRVRYAARLDPSMPWQGVSVSMLEQFADQLANQALLVDKEASRLAAVYEIAGTTGRNTLRVKRDQNDSLADTIRTASQRVSELQTLIAALEGQGFLKIRLWIEWPEAQQTLLTMQRLDVESDQEQADQEKTDQGADRKNDVTQ